MKKILIVSTLYMALMALLYSKSQTMDIPPEADSASFTFKLNEAVPLSLRFLPLAGAAPEAVTFTPAEEKWDVNKLAPEFKKVKLENHLLKVTLKRNVSFSFYVRPKTFHYNAKDIKTLLPQWQTMPDALQKEIALAVRYDAKNSRVYLDGKYAFSCKGKIRSIEADGKGNYVIGNWNAYTGDAGYYANFEVLDIGATGVADSMKNGKLSLSPGKQLIENIPFDLMPASRSADIAVTRNTNGKGALDVDAFLARDTFDALKEAQVTSVPAGYYSKIHLIFAISPTIGKERKFTVKIGRSSRFGRTTPGGYTDIVLPESDKDFPSNIRKIGTVVNDGRTLDLYLGTFSLALGDYMGLLEPEFKRTGREKFSDYLDVEIFGPRVIRTKPYFSPHLKPTGKPSAVNLFAATLEKAPGSIRMTPARTAYIFNDGEKAEASLKLSAAQSGKYNVEMKILDLRSCNMKPAVYDWEESSERPLRTIKKEAALSAGDNREFKLDLSMPGKGHFAFRLDICYNGERFLTHTGGFVQLAKNDRRATRLESPYSMWWWNGVHDTWADTEDAYRLMHETLGIHKFSYAPFTHQFFCRHVEKQYPALAKEKILPPQMRFYNMPDHIRNDEAKMLERIEKRYQPMYDRYPEVKDVLIFHESYGDITPPEIFGVKKQLTPQEKKRDLSFARVAEVLARWHRKKHPDVKLVFGNQTSSTAIVAALLRSGFDPKYIDKIGLETPGQGSMPERIWQGGTQASLYMKELLKYYRLNIPLTACYEYTALPSRRVGYDGKYAVRDALMAYGNRYDHVYLGTIQTTGNTYTQTIWGDGALLPEPYRYPLPVFPAIHTLTNVLDQAEFARNIQTGSNSIYLQEYSRKRGDYVYAVWAPAGENRMRFVFADGSDIRSIDMYGNSQGEKADFQLNVNAFPRYIISDRKIVRSSVIRRTYAPMPPEMKVVSPLEQTAEVIKLSRALYPEVDVAYINGDFTLTGVNDAEKGKCLEIRLNKKGKISPLNTEFVKLKLSRQIIVKDNMDWIGLWVKGDSGWGKISFDVTDAKGINYISDGVWHDFDCQMTINHDGWRFMRIPFGKTDRELNNPSLGVRWQVNSGWAHSPEPQYPVTITAVNVALRRVAPAPVDWVEVPGCIRIKDLSVAGTSKIVFRQMKPLDSAIQKQLENANVKHLITAGDIEPDGSVSVKDGEIYYAGPQGPIFSSRSLLVKRDEFAYEICFRLHTMRSNRPHTGLSFKIDGRFYFPLSPASRDARFVIPQDKYTVVRVEVKGKNMTCFVNGKKTAQETLSKPLHHLQLIKNGDPVAVQYMAVCELSEKIAAGATVSSVGATNSEDQTNATGN